MGTAHYSFGYIATNSASKEVQANATFDEIDAEIYTVASSIPAATSVNPQTVSYAAVLSDNDNVVTMNVAGANNFTVPLNSSVAFPIGATLTIIQIGAGQTTLVATSGVTINTPSSLTARAQYSTVSLVKIGTDTWIAAGDLT